MQYWMDSLHSKGTTQGYSACEPLSRQDKDNLKNQNFGETYKTANIKIHQRVPWLASG